MAVPADFAMAVDQSINIYIYIYYQCISIRADTRVASSRPVQAQNNMYHHLHT